MVEEQTALLREIKTLAKSKNISLPQKLSYEKEEGLATLEGKIGKDFDEKFIKMMTIDHNRDVKKFKDAREVKDKDVQAFASKHLPAIESHLERIIEIKKDAISWSTVN